MATKMLMGTVSPQQRWLGVCGESLNLNWGFLEPSKGSIFLNLVAELLSGRLLLMKSVHKL